MKISVIRGRDPTFESAVCVTAQHRQMLDQILTAVDISLDVDLDLMQHNQTLPEFAAGRADGVVEVP